MTLETIEAKAFVPAKSFETSKTFYETMGFTCAWSSEDLAYFHHGTSSFLLQNYFEQRFAESFQMHLLVKNADAWSAHIQHTGLLKVFDARAEPPADRDWGLRDFVLIDPSGVCWRIGHNIESG